ncbi:Uncharacterised protein [Mycobacteroides abscessus subsp. abscessus]|nr:Uncharacterised protein [Mycobacteroides abscessus subsp. abscessus]
MQAHRLPGDHQAPRRATPRSGRGPQRRQLAHQPGHHRRGAGRGLAGVSHGQSAQGRLRGREMFRRFGHSAGVVLPQGQHHRAGSPGATEDGQTRDGPRPVLGAGEWRLLGVQRDRLALRAGGAEGRRAGDRGHHDRAAHRLPDGLLHVARGGQGHRDPARTGHPVRRGPR